MWAGRMNKREMQAFQAATEAVSPELAVSGGHPEICDQAVLILALLGSTTRPPRFCVCLVRLLARGGGAPSFCHCEGGGGGVPHLPLTAARSSRPLPPLCHPQRLSRGAWFLSSRARARACCALLLF
eukprot:COSAG01_NODE_229_length_21089_cov_575.019194_4_plen_127_part_00